MKKISIVLIFGICFASLVSASFLGFFNGEEDTRYCMDESDYENLQTSLEKQDYENLQPNFYFTAPEYPYGNNVITFSEGIISIKMDKPVDDIHIARTSGTGSMFPTLPRKSLLIAVKIEEELVVGDIVSIIDEDYNIVHRIIEITDEGYITKGDNNALEDPEIYQREDFENKIVGVLW